MKGYLTSDLLAKRDAMKCTLHVLMQAQHDNFLRAVREGRIRDRTYSRFVARRSFKKTTE